jgi:palmitoyltransferase ZDHHC9/14/18
MDNDLNNNIKFHKLSNESNLNSPTQNEILDEKQNSTNQIQIITNEDDKKNIPEGRKIGKNIFLNIFSIKKVIGSNNNLYLFILIYFLIILELVVWVITNNSFFSLFIYIIVLIPSFLTIYYMLIVFLTEPGIIPKYHPDYIKLNEDEEIKKPQTTNDGKNIVPKIFTERFCKTCKILRPPLASHCNFCDNCVKVFDHHCFFVSNCIGERNHKYFFLFLLYGSIGGILLSFFNFIHFLYVFFFSEFKIWTLLFKNYLYFTIFALLLISFGILVASGGSMDIGCIGVPIVTGGIIINICIYKVIPEDHPSYFNPFTLISLFGALSFTFFVCSTFVVQYLRISKRLTIKQEHSIKDEYIERSRNNEQINISTRYFISLGIRERFKNVLDFLRKPIPESLIDFNRDL